MQEEQHTHIVCCTVFLKAARVKKLKDDARRREQRGKNTRYDE